MTVLVHIQWLDSETQEGWIHASELSIGLEVTHTVGFLINEGDDFVILAHSIDAETESCNGVITIPKAAIKSNRVILEVKL